MHIIKLCFHILAFCKKHFLSSDIFACYKKNSFSF